MKLIEDDGTVIEELPDDVALLVFREDGVSAVTPSGEDADEVPPHVLYAGATPVFLSDDDNQREVMRAFVKARETH